MEHRYRKRSIEVEAFQMTEARRWHNNDWPNWLHLAWNLEIGVPGAFWCDVDEPHTFLHISTSEGVQNIDWDDWIIRGVEGEIYPCKPSVFEKTYEAFAEYRDRGSYEASDPGAGPRW